MSRHRRFLRLKGDHDAPQVPIKLASNLTYDDYLQMVFEDDPFVEQQIDPLAMGAQKPGSHRASAAATGLNTDQVQPPPLTTGCEIMRAHVVSHIQNPGIDHPLQPH